MIDSYYVADLRDRLVHDPWYIKPDVGQPTEFKGLAYTDQRSVFTDIAQTEIVQTTTKIRRLSDRAVTLRALVLAELAASTKTTA
jgi:hypothetical protein